MPSTRRDFLKASLGSTLAASLPATPAMLFQPAWAADAAEPAGDSVLVVVQLAGGNDGLNTLVPFDDDHYGRNRKTLRLTGNEVLKIADGLGFHPGLRAFERLFKDGLLTVVQGVGYPNPNGSHGVSMDIWQTADREPANRQTGWLGRAADMLAGPGNADLPAMLIGEIPRPLALNARQTVVPVFRSINDAVLRVGRGPAEQRFALAAEAMRGKDAGDAGALLDFVRQTTAAAHAASRQIATAANMPSRAEYPPLPLARALRTVAQLIRAEVGVRIYYVELGGQQPGGFDNHANQRDNHASLLRQLSESVTAFVDDLRVDKRLDRVLLMTFSEFGRTLAENGRRGTDHGSAAPMFLAGSRLPGGLIGRHPDLSTSENGGVKHHTDFRRVYAAILEKWLGLDSRRVLGEAHQPLDLRLRA